MKKQICHSAQAKRTEESPKNHGILRLRCAALRMTALLLAALLLTGCAGGGVYVPTGDALFQDSTAAPTLPGGPILTEQRLTLSYDPAGSLNPYTDMDPSNQVLFSLLYQGLFSVDMHYEATPILCKNYSVSRDMETYIFYLESATFSDGTLLGAQDVVASLEAARQSSQYGGRFTYFDTVTALEDGSVQIQLTTPMQNLPMLLDIPIVKATELEAAWPLGTGPYYQQLTLTGPMLVRRTDWWCRADLAATAPGISLLEDEGPTTLRDDFEFGSVGLICADPGSDSYVDIRCDYELWGCESGVFLYLACNEKSDTFSDQKVRSALTYGIDRNLLVNGFYGGFASAATLPASPSWPYYSQKLADQYDYDPEKFRELILEAAPADLDITLLVNSADSRRIRVARKIAEMLTAGGFKVTVKALSGTSYTNALSKGNFDLHLGQTKLSTNMDLSAFFAPKGSLNFGSLSDAALYALCQEALANEGNYYTLYQRVMQSGMLCPILFRSYAVYGQRGLFTDLEPARDHVFWYSLGKNMEDCRID